MNQPLCRIRDLRITFANGAVTAVNGVSLDIMAGDKLAIIGESGSGKSTFARAIAGLLPQHAGVSGAVFWPSSAHAPVAGRDIGFVFQDPGASLNPVLTIGEQIAEVPRHHFRLPWSDAFEQAATLLERVGLSPGGEMLKAYPHQLSGGQRQRAAIAAAIAAKPGLLIADEVTSALDMVTQVEIVRLLDDLVRENGMTLVFITHDIALASGLATRIAVLDRGHLVEEGEAKRMLRAPTSAATARLLAAHRDLSTPPLVTGLAP